MSIAFECPQCRNPFRIPDHYAGKKARCKRCGSRMIVPKASGQPPMLYGKPVRDVPGTGPTPTAVPPKVTATPSLLPEPAMDDGEVYQLADSEPEPLHTSNFEITTLGKRPKSRRAFSHERDFGKASGDEAPRWGRWIGTGFTILFFLGMGLRFVNVARRVTQDSPPPAASSIPEAAAEESTDLQPVADAEIKALEDPRSLPPPLTTPLPEFPPRAPGMEIEPGVTFQEVAVGSARPGTGVPPGHGMTLWLYLPSGTHASGTLPCVLIAPAGSILITGNGLHRGGGDEPEHLPYVRAGFAVLAYGLDGEVPDLNRATNDDLRRASQAFLDARSGLTNAHIALEWLKARVPEVNPNRIYAAGHSSAGTVALLLAEHDPGIKGCVAFAPRSDVAAHFQGNALDSLRPVVPWVRVFFGAYNPWNHPERINVPVFLFHASDDSVVPVAETEAFAETLRKLNKRVTLAVVPDGDHHDAMIRQGLPRAVRWLQEVDRGR